MRAFLQNTPLAIPVFYFYVKMEIWNFEPFVVEGERYVIGSFIDHGPDKIVWQQRGA
jgi:hypothetical protein